MSSTSSVRWFTKESLVKGRPSDISCVEINGQTYSLSGRSLKIMRLDDEWYDDVRDPEETIRVLRTQRDVRVDLFTFWQRLPDLTPHHLSFHTDWDEIAILPTHSFDDWWNNQIKSRVRSLVRKAEKEGIVVQETSYDDEFVGGMTAIFNEAPVRQGRRFWHYGKDFETIRRQFARYIHREHMIGAYYRDELIGFIMLGNAGRFAITGQIISSLKHRDKATNNVLIAKAVEVCEQRGFEWLVYLFWSDDSLGEFKRRCGFQRTRVPRYFVPLTPLGRAALLIGAHKGWKTMLPSQLKKTLKRARSAWYDVLHPS